MKMIKQIIPVLVLLVTLSFACNLYEEGKPEITYLCKEQICDK